MNNSGFMKVKFTQKTANSRLLSLEWKSDRKIQAEVTPALSPLPGSLRREHRSPSGDVLQLLQCSSMAFKRRLDALPPPSAPECGTEFYILFMCGSKFAHAQYKSCFRYGSSSDKSRPLEGVGLLYTWRYCACAHPHTAPFKTHLRSPDAFI